MEALMNETFKTDKITAISVDDKSSREFIYKSVKFAYDGGEVPPICIDSDFKLFRFRNKNSDTYSLSITCNPTNEPFFRELSKVIAKESCKILKDESIKPEDFKLIRDNRSGRSVYAKIYSMVLSTLMVLKISPMILKISPMVLKISPMVLKISPMVFMISQAWPICRHVWHSLRT